MSEIQHFKNVSYVDGSVKVELKLDKFSELFKEAQQWLGDRVLEDCKPYMPHRTGSLQQRSSVVNGGKKAIFPGPYGRFLYGGKVMIDPDTGSPFARAGVKKILTDTPLTYSDAQATDHWFETAKAKNQEYWIDGVGKILGGKNVY